jgi:NAD(P)-dependent dehydrogenase (short-subunit alcohol dehydrogenase family)
MQNKTVLITGGTGGIGKQTALALAKLGAQVIVTGRNQASGEAAVSELKQLSSNSNIDLLLADLASQADVRALAQQFKQKYDHLDVLINNAGAAEPLRRLTADGIETDFAVNVVTPFLLTHLLMDCLKASPGARAITLSGGEHPSKIDLDNLQGEHSFIGLSAYSHSKLVMMAMMYEFAQRMQDSSVTINVCYPGQASTVMTRSVTPDMMPSFLRLIYPIYKLATRADQGESAAKASRASVYLASAPEVQGVNGKYFNPQCKIIDWPKPVLDSSIRQQLWTIAEQLT